MEQTGDSISIGQNRGFVVFKDVVEISGNYNSKYTVHYTDRLFAMINKGIIMPALKIPFGVDYRTKTCRTVLTEKIGLHRVIKEAGGDKLNYIHK